MDGFLNLLKPPGMTSSDAVLFVRKLLPRGVKVGHGGTLDPDAAGVLPICVGRATRLFDYLIDKEKEYLGEVTFGVTTDTQDSTGTVIARCDLEVSQSALEAVLPRFVGDIEQTPPAYSAIKRGGARLYDLARKGVPVELLPRPVQVFALDCTGKLGYNQFNIHVECGKGFYVRTLMHDIGQALGVGGHMSFLLRTRAGAFSIDQSVTLEELKETDNVTKLLYPLDAPLGHLRMVDVGEAHRRAVVNGNPVPAPGDMILGEAARVYIAGAFAGIAVADGQGALRFRAMLLA